MTKARSQTYLVISLAEAILKIESVYEQERDRATDKETIAKSLGYRGIDEASATIISTLTKYGLLESVGSQLKVSKDAENIILLNKGHPDRVEALSKVAFTPYLFSKLRDSFGKQLPNDNILRSFLIKMGFNPKIMNVVVQAYRDTLELIEEEVHSLNHLMSNKQQSEEPIPTQSTRSANSSCLANPKHIQVLAQVAVEQTLQYRIAEDCWARIEFDGLVTRDGIEKLIALLELNADVFPHNLSSIK